MIFDTDQIKKDIIKIVEYNAKKTKKRAKKPLLRPKARPKEAPPSPIKKKLPVKKQVRIKNFFDSLASKKLDKADAKTLLAFLYWSSGSKFPSSNFIAFSNSDYKLIKVFLDLLRIAFKIEEKKIKIHLQLYPTQNIKKMIQFWSDLLDVPAVQFYKPTIVKSSYKPIRQNYYGVCAVRYYNLDLLMAITNEYKNLANII